jgi:hypothetical protein
MVMLSFACRMTAPLLAVSTVVGLGLAACKSRTYNDGKAASNASTSLSMNSYVEACERNVGPLPQAMSCFDPVHSHELTIWTEHEGATKRVGLDVPHENGIKCDNPSPGLVSKEGCLPFNRMATYKSGESTWSLLCRQFQLRDALSKEFDAIGMIGSNAKTGATCFFDSTSTTPLNGGEVPKPESGSSFWLDPAVMANRGASRCVTCHTSYPFLTTPHALGVSPYQADFKEALARAEAHLPRNALSAPYFVVLGRALEAASGRQGHWVPRTLTQKSGGPCVACHRLGEGKKALHTALSYLDQNFQLLKDREALTDRMKVFPVSHFHGTFAANMAQGEGVKNLRAFDSLEKFAQSPYRAAAEELASGCKSMGPRCAHEKVPGAE